MRVLGLGVQGEGQVRVRTRYPPRLVMVRRAG